MVFTSTFFDFSRRGLGQQGPPTSVTYSEVSVNVGEDVDYIPVQMHKPLSSVLLPAKKVVDVPDKEMRSLSITEFSRRDQDPSRLMALTDENESKGLNKKKREKGFLKYMSDKDDDSSDKSDSGGFFEEKNGGWA